MAFFYQQKTLGDFCVCFFAPMFFLGVAVWRQSRNSVCRLACRC